MPEAPAEPTEPVLFDWRIIAPITRQLNAPDPAWWGRLRDIAVPTLIVGGGATSDIPQDKLAEAARLIPDCRLVTIEGAGHFVHENKPDAFLEIVRGFLIGDDQEQEADSN